jgi:hypothetical protein
MGVGELQTARRLILSGRLVRCIDVEVSKNGAGCVEYIAARANHISECNSSNIYMYISSLFV